MTVEIISDEDGARVMRVVAPLTDDDALALRAGDRVRISGVVWTARDAAHARLATLDAAGEPWPFPAEGAILYYTGPTPTRPGQVVGSAGPTTASRMDKLTDMTLLHGVKAVVGKGERGAGVRESLQKHHAVALAAIGGLGAILARSITASEVVAFEELGTEAIRRLEVTDFPAVVVQDAHGGDLYAEARAHWREKSA